MSTKQAPEQILEETLFKLIKQEELNSSDLNYLLGEVIRLIEFRKNEKLYNEQFNQNIDVNPQYFEGNSNEVSVEASAQATVEQKSVVNPQSIDASSVDNSDSKKALVEIPSVNTKTFKDVLSKNLSPSDSIVSSNSVTSTNSSHNSEQKYFIRGINEANEAMIETMKQHSKFNVSIDDIIKTNKIITNPNDFINSMLDYGIPMWKIMYYFYMSNKNFDISASTSQEDARQNDKKDQILEDYSNNKLIDFDIKHPYYKYIEYYFNKTIDTNGDTYTCKKDKNGNPIVLILKKRFLLLINKFIKSGK
jgi:hypothetical protein